MYLKMLMCLGGALLAAAIVAARDVRTYYNTSAHALKVYGHSYYNPMTGKPLEGELEDEGGRLTTPRISFRGLPCACVDRSCGCCAGLNMSVINFDRRYCANFTYDPSLLTVDVKVMMNENEIFKTNLSARNPPPMCVPLVYVPVVDFCLRFYDVSLPGGSNLQTCIDFETRLAHSPLLVMHFNCVRVGTGGIAWLKPGEDEANSTGFSAASSTSGKPDDVFDDVNFEIAGEVNDGYAINGTTLSPEDEEKIGEHRIT